MRDLEKVLANCIDDIKSGRASVEGCLERYYAWRNELEPLLRLALRLPPLPDTEPSQELRLRARRALQQEIAETKPTSGAAHILTDILRLRPRVSPRFSTPLLIVLLLVVIVTGSSTAVVYASQGSLPGDNLYPVKTATERARLVLTFTPVRKAEYHLGLAQTRLKEVLSLAQAGRQIDAYTIEAIADQVDAALIEVRMVSSSETQAILGEFWIDMGRQKEILDDAKQQAGPSSLQPLSQTQLLVQRVQLITKSVSEDPGRLTMSISVRNLREGTIKGPISSLEPLHIGGFAIVLPLDVKVEGELVLGRVAEVKGVFIDDNTLRADHIEVEEEEEHSQFELKGPIASLEPLTVAGRIVVLRPDAAVEGVPEIGLVASIEGELREDGSVLASALKVEHLKKETELRGIVTSLEPLIVGKTVIVLDPDTDVEGLPSIGALVELEGSFLTDGRFLASEIKVSEGESGAEERQVKGVIVEILGTEITVEAEDARRYTLSISDRTRIRLEDSSGGLSGLRIGTEIEVRFDSATMSALEIKIEEEED